MKVLCSNFVPYNLLAKHLDDYRTFCMTSEFRWKWVGCDFTYKLSLLLFRRYHVPLWRVSTHHMLRQTTPEPNTRLDGYRRLNLNVCKELAQ